MKKLVKYVYILFSITLIIYVLVPSFEFPSPANDFLQSNEPGDTESGLRRAYFTNLSRSEVLDYYVNEFKFLGNFALALPTYRLNYPPEEAQIIIKDQTRSTFLEEVVHPFRESFFVNGFKPETKKDAIVVAGMDWVQKITVKYVPSRTIARTISMMAALLVIPFLYKGWCETVIDIKKVFKEKYGEK